MELRAARSRFERIGASMHADLARGGAATRMTAETSPATTAFGNRVPVATGDHWTITYEGRTFTLRDLRGLRYLCRLLGQPGRSSTSSTSPPTARSMRSATTRQRDGLSAPGDAGPLLDEQAKDIVQAPPRGHRRGRRGSGDVRGHRTRGACEGRARFHRPRAVTCFRPRGSGSPRRFGLRACASERHPSVRHAMTRIKDHHPELGEHLDRTVRTGTYCAYLPDRGRPQLDVLTRRHDDTARSSRRRRRRCRRFAIMTKLPS